MKRCDLMDAAAVLRFLQQLFRLGNRNGPSLAGVVEHVADMPHEDAQSFIQVAAAFVHHATDSSALAWGYAQVAFVVFDVFAAAFVIDFFGVGRDCALHRNHAHDASSHRSIGRMLDLACCRMLLERIGNLRMRDTELLVNKQKFENAGSIGGQKIDFQPYLRYDDLNAQTDIGDLMQNLSGALHRHPRFAGNHRYEARFHTGQCEHDRNLLVCNPLFKDLIFRAVGGDLVVSVVDLFTQADQVFSDFHAFSSFKATVIPVCYAI